MGMQNDANVEKNLTCQFKIDMRNLKSVEELKKV